jgi:hypothetical protein
MKNKDSKQKSDGTILFREQTTMSQYLKKMDFKLLKEQKTQLIKLQAKIGKTKDKRFSQKDLDTLEGMINFCDSIQDIAVDEYGYPERKVFRRTRKDN